MTLTAKQNEALAAPLDAGVVRKNPKGHDYLEGWHVIAEANRIFGFGGWDRYLHALEQVGPPYEVNGNQRVAYRATVRIVVRGAEGFITRDGTGYGSGIGKDLNDAHESAVKEAETDAMKRALMTFGNPFGLALYDKAKSNVVELPQRLPAADQAMVDAIEACPSKLALGMWAKANGAAVKASPNADRIYAAYEARDTALTNILQAG